MRHESQTFIALIRNSVEEWRKSEGWSRETVCQSIVDTHIKNKADQSTGLEFEPGSRDAFKRQKANADRIYRWLDDVSKDSTLLPTNFIPTVIHALPRHIRLACINEFLSRFGMHAEIGYGAVCNLSFDPLHHAVAMTKEGGEAVVAMTLISSNPTDEQLITAARELDESIATKELARRDVQCEIDRRRAAK